MAKKAASSSRSNDEIRQLILHFFYNRNSNATSLRGKKGSALKMSDVRSELKALHILSQTEVISNLNYLLSQEWIREEIEKKTFNTKNGVSVPSETKYYSITASGIDKIEGPSQFTPKRYDGINIQATGSVVTIGDGNTIHVNFKEAAEALSELRNAVSHSKDLEDTVKLDVVTDIDSIQNQLVKQNPNRSVIQTLWKGIEASATIGGLVDLVTKVSGFISLIAG